MRIAFISDIHGNLAALDAVLAEIEHERPDEIVVGGDVVSGPFPVEVLERLTALERVRFVRGNGDREAVEAFDRGERFDPAETDSARRSTAWVAERLTRWHRDLLAAFEDRVVLDIESVGEVLFCHGSPRSDEEIMTRLTPIDSMRRLLSGVDQSLVVCGHTHVQFDRTIDGTRVVNAGSVGMPYEGRPGAFWLSLGPDVQLRCTDYDHQRAAEGILAGDYCDKEDFANEVILQPPDPLEAEGFFERVAADRGERD